MQGNSFAWKNEQTAVGGRVSLEIEPAIFLCVLS